MNQIDTRLVKCHRVERRKHANVMHVRLGRCGEAVAIHRQTVHDVQIHHLAVHVADHSLIRFGHRLEKVILLSFDPLVFSHACGMNPTFAVRRGDTNGHVLQRTSETTHRMPFEMRKHEDGIIVVDMPADDVIGDMAVLGYRNLDLAAHVHDLDRSDVVVSTFLEHGKAFFGSLSIAVVCRCAFHQCSADLLYQIPDQRGIQIIGFFGFSGMDFDGDLTFRPSSQRMICGNQTFWRNHGSEEHLGSRRIICTMFQFLRFRNIEISHNPPRFCSLQHNRLQTINLKSG